MNKIRVLMFSIQPIILLAFLFISYSIIFAQQNKIDTTQDINSFTYENLVPGVPLTLKEINFFSKQDNFSYSLIYRSQSDSIYFVHKNTVLNSDSNLLILTSKGVMNKFEYLIFSKTNNKELFASTLLKIPYGKSLGIKIYFLPAENKLLYHINENETYQDSPLNSINKFKSKYDINIVLGIRDEMFFIPNSSFNSSIIPENIHLTFGIRILELAKVYGKVGIMGIYNDFGGGIDYGLFLQVNILKTSLYGTIGIDYSGLFGQLPHGLNYGNEGSLKCFCFGVGYETSKHFEMDVIYYVPSSKIVVSRDFANFYDLEQINRGFVGLGFQYSFIL